MRILAIDVGTGTQDIVIFDSKREPENCFKMVMPAPTQILAARVRQATRAGQTLVLAGSLMGGGPVSWAIEEHIKSGHSVLAEPEAARTINDDLERVQALGVQILPDGETGPAGAVRLVLGDLDLHAIAASLAAYGLDARWDGMAVAVLDHGEAPPGVSDREFRFQHISRVAAAASSKPSTELYGDLLAYSYRPDSLPPYLTRMAAVARTAKSAGIPLALLDTGMAAALGALQDPKVAHRRSAVLVNVGNMHTLATHLVDGRIAGIMEHHTHRLTAPALGSLVSQLAAGELTHEAVFADHGHGCFIAQAGRSGRPFVSVTGPRRGAMSACLGGPDLAPGSPYMAVPYGDMMIAGCWGLVRAFAHCYPEHAGEIGRALMPPTGAGRRN